MSLNKLKGSTANEKPFTLVGNIFDGLVGSRLFVLENRDTDHVPCGSYSSSQGLLRFDKHIGYVLHPPTRTFSSQRIGR